MGTSSKVIAGTVAGLAALALSTPAVASTHTASPFNGSWQSTDTDGSHQTLTILGSAPAFRTVRLLDEMASVCGGTPAEFTGSGPTDGTVLDVSGTLRCRPGGNPFRARIEVSWTYNASDDTLEDGFGVVWYRTT
jgi:hypothetical protein